VNEEPKNEASATAKKEDKAKTKYDSLTLEIFNAKGEK